MAQSPPLRVLQACSRAAAGELQGSAGRAGRRDRGTDPPHPHPRRAPARLHPRRTFTFSSLNSARESFWGKFSAKPGSGLAKVTQSPSGPGLLGGLRTVPLKT